MLAAAGSCSTPQNLQGEGAGCFLATDCQEGLVCVPQANGTKICSKNLTPIVMPAEAGGAADAPPEGAADASTDAVPSTDAGADETPADVSAPPQDTGSPPDVGTTPDTSAPPPDTGTAPEAALGDTGAE